MFNQKHYQGKLQFVQLSFSSLWIKMKALVSQTHSKCSDKQLLSQETRKHPGNRSPLKYKKSYEKTWVIIAIIIAIFFQAVFQISQSAYSYSSYFTEVKNVFTISFTVKYICNIKYMCVSSRNKFWMMKQPTKSIVIQQFLSNILCTISLEYKRNRKNFMLFNLVVRDAVKQIH